MTGKRSACHLVACDCCLTPAPNDLMTRFDHNILSSYHTSIQAVSGLNDIQGSLSPATCRRAKQSQARAGDAISAAAAQTLLFMDADQARSAAEAANRDILTHWQPLGWALRSHIKRDLAAVFQRWRAWRRPPPPSDHARELMRHNFVKWRDFVYRRKCMRVLAGTVRNVAFRALTRPAFGHWRSYARWLTLKNAAVLAEWRKRELRERFDKWVQWTQRRIWLRRLLHRMLGASRTGMLLFAWQRWVRHTRFLRAIEIMQKHMRMRKAWVLWRDALRLSRALAGMSARAAARRYWQRWRAFVARRRRERYFRMLWARLQRKAALRRAWAKWLLLPPVFRPEFVVRPEDLSIPAPPSPASTASTLPEFEDRGLQQMRPALCACLRALAPASKRYSGVPRGLLRMGGHEADPGGVHYRQFLQRGLMKDSPGAIPRDKRGHLQPCPVHGVSRGGAGRSALAQQAAANKRAADALAAYQSMSRADIEAKRGSSRAARLRRQAEAAASRRSQGQRSRELARRAARAVGTRKVNSEHVAAPTVQRQTAERNAEASRRRMVGGRCSANEHMLRRLDAATEVFASVNRGRGSVFQTHSSAPGEAVAVPFQQVGPPGRLDWDESAAVWPNNEHTDIANSGRFVQDAAEQKQSEDVGSEAAAQPSPTQQVRKHSDSGGQHPPAIRSVSPPGGGPVYKQHRTHEGAEATSEGGSAQRPRDTGVATLKPPGWNRPGVPAAVAVSTDRWMEELPAGAAAVAPSGDLVLRSSAPYAPLSQMRGQQSSLWVDTFVQPYEVRGGAALRRSVDTLHDLRRVQRRSESKWSHK